MAFNFVILLGAPGAGKGTQGQLLAEHFNFAVIGSGRLLRQRKQSDDFTGRKIAASIDAGNRVPTPVIFRIWMEHLEKLKQQENLPGIILDGSPRSIAEAEMLHAALEWYEWLDDAKALFVNISEGEALERIMERRLCSECRYVSTDEQDERCARCNGELMARADDTKEGLKKRFAWYRTDVLPVVDFYKEKDMLVEINGEQSIEQVFKEVKKSLQL